MGENRAMSMHRIRVLPAWAVLLIAVGVVVLTAGAVAAVLLSLDLAGLTDNDRVTAQLNALKIGLSVGVGSGGVFALYLAARKQRATELDLTQKADAQALADADATERRVTELYAKAADQMGGDKAVVRLAGLYAMERLAQANSQHRQTVIDVLCGYLRMPYAMGNDQAGDGGPGHDVQELQVRRTAQRILHRHLSPIQGGTGEPDLNYWGELDIDLTGATLVRFALGNTSVRFADFRRARFIGTAQFQGARFCSTIFHDCRFDGPAWFESTSFGEVGLFDDAQFAGEATFVNATFGNALFLRAHFAGKVTFDDARFVHNVEFDDAVFDGPVSYSGARVRVDSRRNRVLPPGWVVRPATEGERAQLETLVPQRWRPPGGVSADELNMPVTDQIWGYLGRS
jgi:hypothetical protein